MAESSNGSAKAGGHVSAEEVFGTLATSAAPDFQACDFEEWTMPPPEVMEAERLRQVRARAPIPVCLTDRWIPGPNFVAEMHRLAVAGLVVIAETPGDAARLPPAPQPSPLPQPTLSMDTPTLDEPGSFFEGLPSAVSQAGHALPLAAQGGLPLPHGLRASHRQAAVPEDDNEDGDSCADREPSPAPLSLLREHKPEVVTRLRLEPAGGLAPAVVAAARQPPQGDIVLAVPGHKG